MEAVKLSVNIRGCAGKGHCNILRSQHKIPGILYGRGYDNVLVEFSEMELNDVIKKYGEHALVDLSLNGSNRKAIIKEVQREPVNRVLSHLDLKYIKDDERVHADIPIIVKGEDRVISRGGIVQKQLGNVSVEGQPEKLPKLLTADVSMLNIGDKLMVKDMELSSDITTAADLNSVVITITSARGPVPDDTESHKSETTVTQNEFSDIKQP